MYRNLFGNKMKCRMINSLETFDVLSKVTYNGSQFTQFKIIL